MRNVKSKNAFTMMEVIFVIVIIGILAAVAVPRLSATRDDAEITKARVMVASIRNALAMERQKRILRGDFNNITSVGSGTNVFDEFSDDDGDGKTSNVLEYAMASSSSKGNWELVSGTYVYHGLSDVAFKISNGKFVCVTDNDACKQLTN